jgi:hypothetical protein
MELRRVAPVVGLVALLAADAVLIGWAFRPAPADGYAPAATSSTASSSARPTPTSSETSTGKFVAPKAVPAEQYITAVGPRIAWVVRAGSCANPDGMWVTNDQGDSWTQNSLPGRALRLLPESATSALAVGADEKAKCELRLWQTVDAGEQWGKGQSAAKAWTRDPQDPQAVHTSGNLVVRPCGARSVIDLSVLDGNRATVLCANGDVRASNDAGQRWPLAFVAKRALAITVAEGGAGMLIQTDPTCKGVLAVPLDSGKPAKGGQCVTGPTTEGRISVSNAQKEYWLLVGERVYTTEDPLGPWTRTRRDVGA